MTKDLSEVFETFDTDESEAIEVGEVDALLEALGFDTTSDKVLTALAQLQTADPSKITLAELSTWWEKPEVRAVFQTPATKTVGLRELFDRFDADGNGTIDVQELRSMVDAAGSLADADRIVSAIQSVDGNADGQMSWDEFQTWWAALHQ